MNRIAGLATATVVTLAAVTACGGDDGDDGGGGFCGSLEELNETSPDDLEVAQDRLDELSDNAPDELQEDVDLLRDNFEALQSGDIAGIDEETTAQLQDAVQAISDYAVNECDIDVEL